MQVGPWRAPKFFRILEFGILTMTISHFNVSKCSPRGGVFPWPAEVALGMCERRRTNLPAVDTLCTDIATSYLLAQNWTSCNAMKIIWKECIKSTSRNTLQMRKNRGQNGHLRYLQPVLCETKEFICNGLQINWCHQSEKNHQLALNFNTEQKSDWRHCKKSQLENLKNLNCPPSVKGFLVNENLLIDAD